MATEVLALCFSGSGCLAAYQLGVARCLRRNGAPMMQRVTHVVGTSGGALVATVLARAPDHLDSVIEHSLACRNMAGVEAALAAAGPDAHRAGQRDCQSGQIPELVVVTATAAAPRRQRRFTAWESNADLLACLRASCHIPADFHPLDLLSPMAASYSGGVEFRGETLVDGGLASSSPTLSREDLNWSNQGTALAGHKAAPASASAASLTNVVTIHPGGNPGANLKSISHRCHPILVAFVWELTEETIHLPLG